MFNFALYCKVWSCQGMCVSLSMSLSRALVQAGEENGVSDEEEVVPTPKGRTKKMKGIPYQELLAMQDQRRLERRQKHRHRPKTQYKGLTWHVAGSGKGTWHVQVWTGKTVRPWLYLETCSSFSISAVLLCQQGPVIKEAMQLQDKPSRASSGRFTI